MDLIGLLTYLVIWGLVLYVLWWGLGQIGLPEPFNKIARVLLVIGTVVVLVNLLAGMTGRSLFDMPRLRR